MAKNLIKNISLEILPDSWLDEIHEYLLESTKTNLSKENFYETGYIKLNETNPELEFKMNIYTFLCRVNEVIENLNLTFADLQQLSEIPIYFYGSPCKRFYFLIRMFFYEFYRIKEIHKKFFNFFIEKNILSKKEIADINKHLYNLFKETLQLRNKLVHDDVFWSGEHTELSLLFICEETGHSFRNSDGEIVEYEDILPKLIDEHLEIFKNQTNLIKEHIEKLLKDFVNIFSEE